MKSRKLKIGLLVIPFLLFIFSLDGLSQVRGKVRGTVVDSQGNPVEKATVTIVSTRLASQRYETKSGKDGKFTQVGIYPGYYQVTIKKDGYLPKTFEVHVEIDGDANLEVIKLETADERAMKSLSGADKAFFKANEYYNKQDYEKAAAGFQEAISLSPNNWAYHFNLGLTYKKLNKLAEARESFARAVELNPDSFSANKEMGELLARESEFEEAAGYYRKAVSLSPNDSDAHYNLGVCLVNLGQSEEAQGHFQKAVELKSDYAEAYFQLGSIYISQNKKEEAIASLEKFIELAPQHEKAALAQQLLEYLRK
ncbi:MAG: tetratricopeptide repeat protein [Candidatus Aminicenantes bacterium]|nr:tetratricopeptide repeat protein [Candidatus Aminicenantes bacterium]